MNHGFEHGDYNSQDYAYSQGYRPSGYQSRLNAVRAAYTSQGYAAHRNSYPTTTSSEYISGERNVESDQIGPHKDRSRRQKPKYNNHASSREIEDYISPPVETRDDYISQDFETTHQRTYYQDPWEQYEEPVQAPEKQLRPSRRAVHGALDQELQASHYRPKRSGLERGHNVTLGNDQEAWNIGVYENANDVAEAIRRIDKDSRHARPPPAVSRGMLRSNDPRAWNVGVYEDSNEVVDAIRRIDKNARSARPRPEAPRGVPRSSDQGWNADVYDGANDVVDAIRRIDGGSRNVRPHPQVQRRGLPHSRPEALRGVSHPHQRSIEYDSDLQTCVDSEAQPPGYESGSEIGSYTNDDAFSDRHRSASPTCPGGFPSSPERDYRTSDSSRRYASSSPIGMDDSIGDYSRYSQSPVVRRHASSSPSGHSDFTTYRHSSGSPVHAPSFPSNNSDYARHRGSSGSPVARHHASSPMDDTSDYTSYRHGSDSPVPAPSFPSGNSDYAHYRHSSASPVPRRHAAPSTSDFSDYTSHRESSMSPVLPRHRAPSPPTGPAHHRRHYMSDPPSDFEIDGAASFAESEMENVRRSGSRRSDASSGVRVVNESDDEYEGGEMSDSEGWSGSEDNDD
jgi:hypothetical protein